MIRTQEALCRIHPAKHDEGDPLDKLLESITIPLSEALFSGN
jgi:hypothetical protein